jgi:uncharacterized protein YbjT (DUF2867 family)
MDRFWEKQQPRAMSPIANRLASVAVKALIDPALPSGSHVLTGPGAITYEEMAHAITQVVGRPVRHCRLSTEELAARYAGFGIPQHYASILAGMDEAIAHGAEDRTTMAVQQIAARPANTFACFLSTQCAVFSPDRQ